MNTSDVDIATHLKLAVWQTAFFSSPDEVLEQLDQQASRASQQGAKLLVCPEMIITGYAVGLEKLQKFGLADQQVWTQKISAIAKKHAIAIAYGFPDYSASPFIYNACQFINENGKVLAKYAKTHLYGSLDREQFQAGQQIGPCFDWQGWRVGMLICYDIEFAAASRTLARLGAEMILVPTANMPEFPQVPRLLVPARAYENSCYVVYANAVGSEVLHNITTSYGGLSTVASPKADTVQAGTQAQLLLADLFKNVVLESRAHSQLHDEQATLYWNANTSK